jgi:outer membrane immunogenic protein
MWTGFYGGLNAGYGFGTSDNVYTRAGGNLDNLAALAALAPPGFLTGAIVPGGTALANSGMASVNQNGFIGGGQIGYNYQWGSNFVVGLEADIDGAGIRGSGGYNGAYTDAVSVTGAPVTLSRLAVGGGQINAGVDWMGTVRGRVGYLFTPSMLVFATGGLAYGGVHADAVNSANMSVSATVAGVQLATIGFPTGTGSANFSDTRVGWTVGGGLEWMFMPSWSLKAEALYYDLGSATFASSPVSAVSPVAIAGLGGVLGGILGGAPQMVNTPYHTVSYAGVIARVGVNYHFNWSAPAPVVAKY